MITIDTREPTEIVKLELMEIMKFGCVFPDWEIATLEYGDYLLKNDNISMLIERKEYKDYINSIGDGLKKRLFHMHSIADYTVLLIEGLPPYFEDNIFYQSSNYMERSGVSVKAYGNFMVGTQLDSTFILQTINIRHTLMTIAYLYDYIGRIDKRSDIKPFDNTDLISLLPGIGKKKANKIKAKYSSPLEALKHADEYLSEKDLTKLQNW
jgi:ERCC4-type nuclease